MLLGLLLPDPCDEELPEDFKKQARDLLPRLVGEVGPKDEDLRRSLLKFIGDFANWDFSNHPVYLEIGRGLVKAAHGKEAPLVVDPFAGGGSIPLEALRLGCEAFASDLNPVACLILKLILEDIPRLGLQLADKLQLVSQEIMSKAERELAEMYPPDPDGATPIAYLWARTVQCESPNCGAEIPLMRSFWLCKKANRKRALRYDVFRPKGEPPFVDFAIFEPKNDKDASGETVTRAKAKCLCCGMVLSPERVRAQLAEQRGGADVIFDDKGTRIGGARMLAVVTLQPSLQRRHYRLPSQSDYQAVRHAQQQLNAIINQWECDGRKGPCPVPNESLPPIGTLGFRVQRYGMLQWGDLFTARQKLGLLCILRFFCSPEGPQGVQTLLSLIFSKHAELTSANCPWEPVAECPRKTFNMQALPVRWEFAESVIGSDSSGGIRTTIGNAVSNLSSFGSNWALGAMQLADACDHPLPGDSAALWFTDPPYYDAVPYADLSDFFLVWLKRTLPRYTLLRDPFDPANPLAPKRQEAVQDETKRDNGQVKDRGWFEAKMAKAFDEGRRVLHEDGVGCVVFAHKTTEGWEALLSGIIQAGLNITASWPIQTEQVNRPRARESAALATSVHLVCRPRPEDAPVGDWANVLRELPNRVGDWMERLQGEGIRGADLVFACIGPALEIFSRYRTVETADGREVKLDEYLEKVWEVVGRSALEQVLGTVEARTRNGAAGALEEDARLTALFLWTLQSTNGQNGSGKELNEELEDAGDDDEEEATPKGKAKGYSLIFDVVRRFAQPLGIDLPKWEGRVIETKKGVVRLMAVSERAKQLFGDEGADAVADWIEREPRGNYQMLLFPELERNRIPKIQGRKSGRIIRDLPADAVSQAGVTTLDRVHAAMLLQAGGQANALRALIKSEQDRGPDFLRLSNALSALYPTGSEEKRLLDAMLLAVPR